MLAFITKFYTSQWPFPEEGKFYCSNGDILSINILSDASSIVPQRKRTNESAVDVQSNKTIGNIDISDF